MHGHLLPAAVGMFGVVFSYPVARRLGQHTRWRWLAKLGSSIGLLCIFKIILRWQFTIRVSWSVRWAQRPLPIPVVAFNMPALLRACVQVWRTRLMFVCSVQRWSTQLISSFSSSWFWFQQLRTNRREKKKNQTLKGRVLWTNSIWPSSHDWHLELHVGPLCTSPHHTDLYCAGSVFKTWLDEHLTPNKQNMTQIFCSTLWILLPFSCSKTPQSH